MNFDKDLIEILSKSENLVVITGSGISAESGIPTFRGEDGLWKRFRAEDLATEQAFFRDPELVWQWYDWRRGAISGAGPNPAHEVIAGMESHFREFLLITQNVDGLHARAGSRKLVEIHGNIWRVRCTEEGSESWLYDVPLRELPPRCECGALLRPAVVWFGEPLPADALQTAMRHVERCDVLMTVGTSGLVYPVASFPLAAKSRGAKVVEINLEDTPMTNIADYSPRGRAGDVLPALWRAVLER